MRCFVALWPDEPARERLDELARELHQHFPAARRMRSTNLHLTLAFIGELDTTIAQQVAQRLSELETHRFIWLLDRCGAFGAARVLWTGGADDARLSELAARVRALLDEMKVRYDRKPFVPHVTLLRNLPRALTQDAAASRIDPAISWEVDRAVLVQSQTGERGTRYVAVDASA
jgi:2'-5' RNA ligase